MRRLECIVNPDSNINQRQRRNLAVQVHLNEIQCKLYSYSVILQKLTRFYSKKYQSWGGGKLYESSEDRRELKKAKAEGRLAETLLDRREKMKADRYCK